MEHHRDLQDTAQGLLNHNPWKMGETYLGMAVAVVALVPNRSGSDRTYSELLHHCSSGRSGCSG